MKLNHLPMRRVLDGIPYLWMDEVYVFFLMLDVGVLMDFPNGFLCVWQCHVNLKGSAYPIVRFRGLF